MAIVHRVASALAGGDGLLPRALLHGLRQAHFRRPKEPLLNAVQVDDWRVGAGDVGDVRGGRRQVRGVVCCCPEAVRAHDLICQLTVDVVTDGRPREHPRKACQRVGVGPCKAAGVRRHVHLEARAAVGLGAELLALARGLLLLALDVHGQAHQRTPQNPVLDAPHVGGDRVGRRLCHRVLRRALRRPGLEAEAIELLSGIVILQVAVPTVGPEAERRATIRLFAPLLASQAVLDNVRLRTGHVQGKPNGIRFDAEERSRSCGGRAHGCR
mmetsp:Transcript_43555/g.139955  ORF Transcript_43555/g.139955 Transcript_43555/m.139955 type:complete len:270 (+) Transcript_43555:389-1198(+)